MDSGYWFLATIWTISIIFGVASYLAEHIGKSNKASGIVIALSDGHRFVGWDLNGYGVFIFCYQINALLYAFLLCRVYVWLD